METFATHLLQFANSVDHVSESVLNEIHKIVSNYLTRNLKIGFYEFLVPTTVDKREGLSTEYHVGGSTWTVSIKNRDGSYNGQISYAWDKRLNLWIVEKNKGLLGNANDYENLLSPGTGKDIPPYVDLTDNQIKTSIMRILEYNGKPICILNLESTEYLNVTKILRHEIECICKSLGIIYGHSRTYKIQKESTLQAIASLNKFSEIPLPYMPKIFVSFSDRAEAPVLDKIKETLGSFDVLTAYWKTEVKPGNITAHIWSEIYSSRAAICYLSEPDPSNPGHYKDNPNVIFEIGMIQALAKIRHSVMKHCILIREEDSPDAPFNFASERIIYVPRNKRNKHVNSIEFVKLLSETLKEVTSGKDS